jgi:glutamate formiminotransferase/formiminotetrahydrofolate cyclodeaminase
MVANLSSHKKGWDSRWEEFSNHAEQGQSLMSELLDLVDEDTNAFNMIMSAFSLPKGNDAEKEARKAAIEAATIYAIKVPFRSMELSFNSFELIHAMADKGNPNSVSDAGVGALCARAAVKGCYLNIKINAQGLAENPEIKPLLERAEAMNTEADTKEQEIWKLVLSKIK